jgi:hypothetical protein
MAGCSSTTHHCHPLDHTQCCPLALRTCGSVTLELAHGLALSYASRLDSVAFASSSLRPLPGQRPSAASAPLSRHTHAWYLLCMMSVNRSAQHAGPHRLPASPSNRTCATLASSLSHHITLMAGVVCCLFSFFLSFFPRSFLRASISHLRSSISPRVARSLWT